MGQGQNSHYVVIDNIAYVTYYERVRKGHIKSNYRIWLVPSLGTGQRIMIGEVLCHNPGGFRQNWWAYSSHPNVQSMHGFVSRYYAVGYLLFSLGHYDEVNY